MVYIVAVGFKCPNKIHLNTQWGGGQLPLLRATGSDIPVSDQRAIKWFLSRKEMMLLWCRFFSMEHGTMGKILFHTKNHGI